MTAEEKDLLSRLYRKDEEAIKQFVQKHEPFVRQDIAFHRRLGLDFPKRESSASHILRSFLFLASRLDLSTGKSSIEQILHKMVVDRAYLSPRRNVDLSKRFDESDPFSRLLREIPDYSSSPLEWRQLRAELRKAELPEALFIQRIQVATDHTLTPEYLYEHFAPYINAVASIQHVCNDVLKRPPQEVVIKSITQNSPMDVKLIDAAEAINAIKEDIIPWRRKNAQKIAELKQQELAADIKKKQAETLEIKKQSSRDDEKAEAEIAKMKEEAEQMRLENDRRRFELQKEKLELALEIVSKMQPNLPMAEKYAYAMQLLPSINTLATSDIEPTLLLP